MMKQSKEIVYFLFFFLGIYLISIILIGMPIKAVWDEDPYRKPNSPYRYREWNEPIDNIFDEMMANECMGLRKARYVRRNADDGYAGYAYLRFVNLRWEEIRISQKTLEEQDRSLGQRGFISINIDGRWNEGEMDYYYTARYGPTINLLRVFDSTLIKGEIPVWNELDEIQEVYYYILDNLLIDQWLKTGKSQFTRDDLGEFKIISDIPYAYAGLPESMPIEEVTVKEAGEDVAYTVWLDNGELLCVQQGNRFRTQDGKSGEVYSLENLLFLNDDFYHWLKTSGQATGNLERLPESREAGMANTRKMLQKCPVEEIQKMLPGCEFYLEPGYLHIRFPYWKWESSNPCWELNGDELWREWLNIRTEDIEGFLRVERW